MNILKSVRFSLLVLFFLGNNIFPSQIPCNVSIVKMVLGESFNLKTSEASYSDYQGQWKDLGFVYAQDNEIPVIEVKSVLYCERNQQKDWRVKAPERIKSSFNSFPRFIPQEVFFDSQTKMLKNQLELKIKRKNQAIDCLIVPIDDAVKSALVPTLLIDDKRVSFFAMFFLFTAYCSIGQ